MTDEDIKAMTPAEKLRYLRNTVLILRSCSFPLSDDAKAMLLKLEEYLRGQDAS